RDWSVTGVQTCALPISAIETDAPPAPWHRDRFCSSKRPRGTAMLMITCTETSDTGRKLKLEGKLREPWLDELREVCDALGTPPSRLHLDLSSLTSIDALTARWLGALLRRGAPATACSRFVAEMLSNRQA